VDGFSGFQAIFVSRKLAYFFKMPIRQLAPGGVRACFEEFWRFSNIYKA
jgi:hypothetical protein